MQNKNKDINGKNAKRRDYSKPKLRRHGLLKVMGTATLFP